ncbi:toxin-antitoxin system HicB family antitoxin [Sphingomonas sp. CFBP 13706]|nr:toxin-antitoxin system HicB family antitoxin [Sphingomonas sp. CFBP 13706]
MSEICPSPLSSNCPSSAALTVRCSRSLGAAASAAAANRHGTSLNTWLQM